MATGLSMDDAKQEERKGGIFLSWTKLVIIIMVLIVVLIATVLIVLFTSQPAPSCEPDHLGPDDEELFWEICANFPWTKNERRMCESPDASAHVQKNHRLNRNLVPSHYNVSLKPDFYDREPEEFTLEGHVDIYLTCEAETDVIQLHMRNQHLESLNVTSSGSSELLHVTNTSYDSDTEILELTLNRMLNVSEEIVLSIDFSSGINQRYAGLYYGSYWDIYTERMEYYIATDLQACDAREVFPCLDEPSFKATFETTLWRKDGYISLANTPLEASKNMGDGWHLQYFGRTPGPMVTYLFSIAIGKFEYVEDIADGGLSSKPIRYFSAPEHVRKGFLNYSKSIGGRLFDWLEIRLNEPYSFPKTDMIALPNFTSVGMENWGLITYSPSRLVYDPATMPVSRKQMMVGTIAHELSHMWFGNLLTCEWWNDLWLQEGFANFYERQAIINALPELDLEHMDILLEYEYALRSDELRAAPTLNTPVNTRYEIRRNFNTIAYKKGGCMARMMRELLGHATFDEAIKKYIQKFKYKNIRHDDLFAALEEQLKAEGRDIGTNFTQMMYTWINQAGIPLVTIRRKNESSTTVEVTQNRYRPSTGLPDLQQDLPPSPYGYVWTIPLTYATSKNPDWNNPQRDMLIMENKTITLGSALEPSDWLVANVKLEGYYIVNYDKIGWEAIIKQLNKDHTVFHGIDRATLLASASRCLSLGSMEYVDLLRLTEYLPKEEEYYPNKVFWQFTNELGRLMSGSSTQTHLRMYVRRWADVQYSRLGWDHSDTDPLAVTYLRHSTVTLACKLDVPACVKEATSRFAAWMADPQIRFHSDEEALIMCTGIRHGGDEAWIFLKNYYLDLLTDSSEAVASVVDTFRWSALHDLTYESVAATMIWKKLYDNEWDKWSALGEYQGLIRNLARRAGTESHLKQATEILERDFPDSMAFREEVLLYIKGNIKWREMNLQDVNNWLRTTMA